MLCGCFRSIHRFRFLVLSDCDGGLAVPLFALSPERDEPGDVDPPSRARPDGELAERLPSVGFALEPADVPLAEVTCCRALDGPRCGRRFGLAPGFGVEKLVSGRASTTFDSALILRSWIRCAMASCPKVQKLLASQ